MTAHYAKARGDVVARIVRSVDGGPMRQIGKNGGAKPHVAYVSRKANHRAMPIESLPCELPFLELAEVASPVQSLLAQPHRLELYVRGLRKPMIYFPDFELSVEPGLFRMLMAKEPFAEAMLRWRPEPRRAGGYRKVVVEVKADDDPRNEDEEYQTKLRLASQIYGELGIGFFTVFFSRDISCVDLELVHDIALENYTAISPVDIDLCMRCLTSSGGTTTLRELVQVLGGEAEGRAKAAALHVRRVVSVALMEGFRPSTSVSLFHPRFSQTA